MMKKESTSNTRINTAVTPLIYLCSCLCSSALAETVVWDSKSNSWKPLAENAEKIDPQMALGIALMQTAVSTAVGILFFCLIWAISPKDKQSPHRLGLLLGGASGGFQIQASIGSFFMFNWGYGELLYRVLLGLPIFFLFGYLAGYLYKKLKQSKVDDKFYSQALDEIDTDKVERSLWAQCIAKCKGDDSKAKAMYIEKRAKALHQNKS